MIIPGFTSTGSKRPEALYGRPDAAPQRMVRSSGCRVWDENGREYLDTIMALGAVALGYGHPAVTEAVTKAARDGAIGPLPPTVEQHVAEALGGVLPGVEWVRFLKTGAEAVAAAVRVARAATGRERVLTCGYHGWIDWCQTGNGIPAPIRALRREIPFDDVQALTDAVDGFGPIAAIVVEPVIDRLPSQEWLEALRTTATRVGSCLVFDEIKTAFRIAPGGIAEQSGVVPDLMVVGKALGNGYPIAAVGGADALLASANAVWISSTLATESVSLAAASAVLEVFATESVSTSLADSGAEFRASLQRAAVDFDSIVTGVRGIDQMCYLSFLDNDVSGRVARACAARGLLFKRNAYNFVAVAHSDEVLQEIDSRLHDALRSVADAH